MRKAFITIAFVASMALAGCQAGGGPAIKDGICTSCGQTIKESSGIGIQPPPVEYSDK